MTTLGVFDLVDPASLGHRAMVHPDDDVSEWVAGTTYRQRVARGIHHHERTGRVETHALDRGSREGGFRHGRADGGGASRPDLGRGLLNDAACLVLIHGLARPGKLGGDAALLVAIPASCQEDAGTCGQQNEKLRHI